MTSEDHRPTCLDLATPTLDPCTVRHAGWFSVGLVGYDDGVGMLLVGPGEHELKAWGNLSQPFLAGPTTHDGQASLSGETLRMQDELEERRSTTHILQAGQQASRFKCRDQGLNLGI
jgi:hypothetical protein